MIENNHNKVNVIHLLAQEDSEYCSMLKECRLLEKDYHAVLEALPPEARDTICDYLTKCEEMSWRMLELACLHMEFPAEMK